MNDKRAENIMDKLLTIKEIIDFVHIIAAGHERIESTDRLFKAIIGLCYCFCIFTGMKLVPDGSFRIEYRYKKILCLLRMIVYNHNRFHGLAGSGWLFGKRELLYGY